jgi:endonuclease/exonuclease/phosphatase family metal-dependent hydrolase
MIKQLKKITINMIAGANIATAALMVAAGYADHLHPASHPLLASTGMLFPLFLVANLAFMFFWLTFKKRMALIPVGGYLLAYAPIRIYMPVNLPADMPDEVIKVLSWNVQYYSGLPFYDDGFEPVFQYIRESGADIVCLQEDTDSWRNSKQRFDSLYAYNDTTYLGSVYGNALGIHTRFPILFKERIPCKSRMNGSVAYYLKIGADTVIVVNNHLESNHLTHEDKRRYKTLLRGEMERDSTKTESKRLINKQSEAAILRAPQAEAGQRYIAAHRRYPIIVCGDLNDNPISYARRTVAKGLTDCYVATGTGIGLSYNQKGFFFRIDHIFCSDHFEPYNCKVDSKIKASDHYPMYCWLKMKHNP